MGLVDRLLTIVVTATVTSAAWIVAGGSVIESASKRETRPPPPAALAAVQQVAPVAAAAPLLIPVEGVTADKLRDTYSQARAGGARTHDAIDIMAPRGTPVIAAAPGTVEKLFLSKDGGKTIYLRTDDRGTIHYYAHLDGYAPGLAERQRVARGQQIGTVGSTGNASESAPHLHFAILSTTPDAEWWEPTTAINPYPLLTGH